MGRPRQGGENGGGRICVLVFLLKQFFFLRLFSRDSSPNPMTRLQAAASYRHVVAIDKHEAVQLSIVPHTLSSSRVVVLEWCAASAELLLSPFVATSTSTSLPQANHEPSALLAMCCTPRPLPSSRHAQHLGTGSQQRAVRAHQARHTPPLPPPRLGLRREVLEGHGQFRLRSAARK